MGKESTQEQILRASKEIAVKFIEVGRLSPTNFAEIFKTIYDAIDATVRREPVKGEGDGSATGR
ncbi:MAG: hypothetical protein C4519_08075 [Desulfobacteraceae bacterium]|nr:MAG: hypothetical protein C4519_08075 [Desulfobacteraceae bacterium]